MPTLTTLIQHSSGSPSQNNQAREKIKGIQIRKEEVQVSLLVGDIILYTENPGDSTESLLETINKCHKVAGYKTNVHKSTAFLYTNNETSEREKKIPFAIVTKRIKHLGINLTKDVTDLYNENYKALLKEIEKDTTKRNDIPCSQIRRINIVLKGCEGPLF